MMALTQNQKIILSLTDCAVLFYWVIMIADMIGWITLDPSYMYSNHQDPTIIAWNLSFLPLDLAFALLGLAGIFLHLTDEKKSFLNIVSLSLMFCAGLMAISFWTIIGDYKPFWWIANFYLIILPLAIGLNRYHQLQCQTST